MVSPLVLWFRRLRVDRVPLAVLAVTVFVTAGLAAAGPLLAVRASRDALTQQLARANAAERSLVISTAQILQTDEDPGELVAEADRLGALFDAQIPALVRSVLDDPFVAHETVPWDVAVQGVPPNPFRRSLILVARDGADEQVQLIEGRAARGIEITPPDPVQGPLDPPNPATVELELTMSDATAAAMGIEVGDRLDMTETSSPLGSFGIDGEVEPIVIGEVTGIFSVPDPEDPFWGGDRRLVAPNEGDSSAAGAAIVSLDILGTFLSAWPRAITLTYAYPAGAEQVAAVSPARLVVAFNDLRTNFRAFAGQTFFGVDARTGIPTLLNAYLAGERQAFLLLGLVGLGVAGIAAAALVLLGVLLADRRRAALVIQRERGAGPWQIVLPALVEAVLMCVPAALLGWVAAVALWPAQAGDLPLRLALGVAAAAIVACVLLVLPVAWRDLRGLLRGGLAPANPSARRLVVDGLVVALAVIGLVFVRSRGIAGEGDQGFNAYLAAVPLLAGLAAGLVVLRVYPYPVRALALAAGRLRGLVAPLALRRAGRAPGAVNVPLVALLVAAALGAFGATVAASIDRGQSLAAWRVTGADYRISSATGGLPTTIDPAAIDGVTAVAPVWTGERVPLISSTGISVLTLVGVDPDSMTAAVGGTPADPRLPAGLDTAPAGEPGTPAAPIPAVISANLGDFRRDIGVGETFELVLAGERLSFTGIEERTTFAGIAEEGRFAVVSRELLAAAMGLPELRAGSLYVRGSPGLEAALRDDVGESGEIAFVTSRAEVAAGLRDAPLVTTVTTGFLVSLIIAAGYVTLTLIIGLLLAAAARARDVAYLRTMGLSTGQTLRMAIVEQVPPILVAVAAGAALGLGIAALIGGALDLGAFAGADIAADLTIDWPLLGLAGAWMLLVAAIGVAIGALAARRVDPARALRIGE